MYFFETRIDKRLEPYRKELACEVNTDEYPLPVGRFQRPVEKILEKRLGWKPLSAVDVCCTKENRRYKKYLPDSLNESWHKHGKFIWCMTPYGDNQQRWAQKCIQEANNGCVVAALYAFRENTPAKWIQSLIFDSYFNVSMGRVRIDHWRHSTVDHLLVVYGINPGQSKRLMADLTLLRYHLGKRINIKRLAGHLNITVEMCVRICNKIGLLKVVGCEPVEDGRSRILWHEFDLVKKQLDQEIRTQEAVLLNWGFETVRR